MGKPFEKELEKNLATLEWAQLQDITNLSSYIFANRHHPLFIVGSGGSLSACYYAAYLYQKCGSVAKAVTPLELYNSRETLKDANVLFLSASGRNSDILFAFKTAVKHNPRSIACICMRRKTPLATLAEESPSAEVFEFELPSGKDGFLATNSLVAFFGILNKAISGAKNVDYVFPSLLSLNNEVEHFLKIASPDCTFVTLFGGLSQCIAVDIESKLVEAALSNVVLSDYRNFAHGRHHWFAKRGRTSAIIALVAPEDEKLANKTLSLLPKQIPILYLKTEMKGEIASIDLLLKSFAFINALGKRQKIDPGRPGVPEYGSKLYHLRYSSLLTDSYSQIDEIIMKKSGAKTLSELSTKEKAFWVNAHEKFIKKISTTSFGSIVFDFDGTLCSSKNRSLGITDAMANSLIRILSKGFVIGIATGRGKSVKEDLQSKLPAKLWSNVIVGYYNGSDCGLLSNNSLPNKEKESTDSLKDLYQKLLHSNCPIKFQLELRPFQLTIEPENSDEWSKAKYYLIQTIKITGYSDIEFLESSHSIDIVCKPQTSKLKVVERCKELASKKGLSPDVLCIGDKGQWPGNDYELLSTPYSLSVDEVSPLPDCCWNLSRSGFKNSDATLEYLEKIIIDKKALKIALK